MVISSEAEFIFGTNHAVRLLPAQLGLLNGKLVAIIKGKGNVVPTVATGTFCPAATLSAPQMIWVSSSPRYDHTEFGAGRHWDVH
ncbi:MAG: hypothetical protein U5J95_01235 [Balneolaceae bacterium]|nr:hypothetical protein [Balneolaceae bacterium]